jgi:hypothetical protein
MRFQSVYILVLGLTCLSLAYAHSPENPEQYASDSVEITGLVERVTEFTLEDIRSMPATELGETEMRCREDRLKYVASGYRGVLLRDLINKVGVSFDSHRERNRMYIVAGATDDYFVVFSWHELFNSELGDKVLVFYERDGQDVDSEEGPLALISAADTYPCGRHVKWLNSIEIRRYDH